MDMDMLRKENLELLARLQEGQLRMKSWLNSSLRRNAEVTASLSSNSLHECNKLSTNSVSKTYFNVNTQDKTPVKVKFVDQCNYSLDSGSSSANDSVEKREDMTDKSSGITERDMLRSPPHLVPSRGTPKSVLKRRDIIDRNVKLDSELRDRDYSRPKSRLQLLEMLHNERAERSNKDSDISDLYYSSDNRRPDSISTRTALHPFPNDNAYSVQRTLNKSNDSKGKLSSKDVSGSTTTSGNTVNWRTGVDEILRSEDERPLLGYDWIAADLDNSQNLSELSDSFLDDIKQFRSRNKAYCEDRNGPEKFFSWFSKPPPAVKSMSHTCVHGYVLNDRLYPEPINSDEDGKSVCPVCLVERQDPTPLSPGFVRISIPKNSLVSPYIVKPHRRKSFDAADTVSLARHCMIGWESSKPSALPPASTMDLRQAVDGFTEKLVTDIGEEKNLINSLEAIGKRLTTYHGKDKALDMHRSLLFELENQIKDGK